MAALLLLLACAEPVPCAGYGDPLALAQVEGIDEASGLAVSARHSGVVWTHNDAGDSARVFAVDTSDGSVLATLALASGAPLDSEDLAIGPQGEMWLADIGDNEGERSTVQLFRFPEPDLEDGAVEAEAWTLSYEDGPRDAEALFVDTDGTAYVLDKQVAGRTTLYRAELDSGLLIATARFSLAVDGSVTGADLSPEGDRLMLRTTYGILLYRRVDGEAWEAVMEGIPCLVPSPAEAQGEALAIGPSGAFTLSEGEDPTLFRIPRT